MFFTLFPLPRLPPPTIRSLQTLRVCTMLQSHFLPYSRLSPVYFCLPPSHSPPSLGLPLLPFLPSSRPPAPSSLGLGVRVTRCASPIMTFVC